MVSTVDTTTVDGGVMQVKRWSRWDQGALEDLLWILPLLAMVPPLAVGVSALRGQPLEARGAVPPELVTTSDTVTGRLTGAVEIVDPTATQYGWALAPMLLFVVLALVASRLLLGVARGLRTGDPFTTANARRLTSLAVLLVLGGAFLPWFQAIAHEGVLDPLLPGGPRNPVREVQLWSSITGMLVLFLAEVFARGARLREDVEGLV